MTRAFVFRALHTQATTVCVQAETADRPEHFFGLDYAVRHLATQGWEPVPLPHEPGGLDSWEDLSAQEWALLHLALSKMR